MPLPTMTPVKSSNVQAIGYDGSNLFVRFGSGGVYEYAGVPKSVHDAALLSPSVGSFIATQVKGKFTARKLEVA